MASGPITSWEIDGETVETVSDFIFLGSKNTADDNCSHEIKRRLLLGRKVTKRWEPRGFSRVAAAFSSYDGVLSLPLGLALGSPIFPSGCEGTLGVALESLQCLRDLT